MEEALETPVSVVEKPVVLDVVCVKHLLEARVNALTAPAQQRKFRCGKVSIEAFRLVRDLQDGLDPIKLSQVIYSHFANTVGSKSRRTLAETDEYAFIHNLLGAFDCNCLSEKQISEDAWAKDCRCLRYEGALGDLTQYKSFNDILRKISDSNTPTVVQSNAEAVVAEEGDEEEEEDAGLEDNPTIVLNLGSKKRRKKKPGSGINYNRSGGKRKSKKKTATAPAIQIEEEVSISENQVLEENIVLTPASEEEKTTQAEVSEQDTFETPSVSGRKRNRDNGGLSIGGKKDSSSESDISVSRKIRPKRSQGIAVDEEEEAENEEEAEQEEEVGMDIAEEDDVVDPATVDPDQYERDSKTMSLVRFMKKYKRVLQEIVVKEIRNSDQYPTVKFYLEELQLEKVIEHPEEYLE